MWVLMDVTHDIDGTVYAGQPTVYEKEEEAIENAKEQLADDFGISLEDVDDKVNESGNPCVLSMSQDGRFEAYTVAWV